MFDSYQNVLKFGVEALNIQRAPSPIARLLSSREQAGIKSRLLEWTKRSRRVILRDIRRIRLKILKRKRHEVANVEREAPRVKCDTVLAKREAMVATMMPAGGERKWCLNACEAEKTGVHACTLPVLPSWR